MWKCGKCDECANEEAICQLLNFHIYRFTHLHILL